MARIRLKYDLQHGGPFFMGIAGSRLPSNVPCTAKVLNVGSATYPIRSTTSGNIVDLRGRFAHTSGIGRVIYNRLYLYGSAGGDSLRAFTSVMANVNTAAGAHISLNFVATAGGSECSGLGVAGRNTLHIPDIASWAPAGTYAALQAEIYSDGAASDPAGMTELSLIRLVNDGDGTGKADVDTDAFLFSIQGFTAAGDTTKLLSSVSLAELPASSVALRCKIGATTYYLPLVLATELN